MVGDILQPTHLIFILVVALLVLGPKRLPEVGRSLGRGLRDFKGALSGEEPERHHDEVESSATAPDPAPVFEPEPAYEPPAETHEPVSTAYDASTEAVHDDVPEVFEEPAAPTSPFAGLSQRADSEPVAAPAKPEAEPRPEPAAAATAPDTAKRAS